MTSDFAARCSNGTVGVKPGLSTKPGVEIASTGICGSPAATSALRMSAKSFVARHIPPVCDIASAVVSGLYRTDLMASTSWPTVMIAG